MAMTSLAQNINEETLATEKGSSLWADAYIRLKKNKLAMLGGIVVILILILCFIIAPILAASGMNANEQDLTNRFAGVGEKGVLGTDQLGRDLFMRVLEGGQISLLVAIMATCMTVTIGVIYGGIAGYVGGGIGNTMMRVVDGLLAMPFLIIVILFREIITPYIDTLAKFLIDDWGWNDNTVLRFANLIPLTIAIAGFGWLSMGRIVRSAAASLSKQEFVEAARSLGISHRRILFRHILPNMLGPVIIYATLTIPSFILYEATLSYIGLGIEPPNSSWGKLIQEGANFLETNLTVLAVPAVMFSLTLFAFNFLGDGLRDALDPKASKD
ncbi:MAG: peptide ABC transporter permease [Verrucomicrobiaceae bacterium TMED137]|jgi:oligopeptide transport system permease protein|nr:MAG: peptide ABC transporter permease [Verrucomicrobiaceae bacterium TMED137]HAN83285.1 peptide ABC transporter permease [Verrucomicrobiales bacterium]HBF16722.1 peptide ABC transporter permease [Verrucomicrobiales bacterium]HBI30836.1 peptide ABC transporter permease [Verrucomicrobiales bacterium]HCN81027.1 peptide ABC transporter permease [Verrucomicrobiales bacterium]